MQEPSERVRQLLSRFECGEKPYEQVASIPVDAAATVHALLHGLECREWRGVQACAQALGRATVAHDEAVAGLLGLLGHEEDLVVDEAVEALGKLGPAARTAVPHLLPMLLLPQEAHPFTAGVVIIALGRIGGPMRERIVGELAALVACAAACRSDLRALYAFQAARLGEPPGPLPKIPDYVAEDQFDDGYGLIQCTLEALTALREPAAAVVGALADATRIPNWKVRQCALGGLLAIESAREQGVAIALELLHQDAQKPGAFYAPPALESLYRAGHGFDAIVLGLLDLPKLPPVSWHDPAPGLSRFVASERFTAHAYLVERSRDPLAAVRAQAARLLGYLGDRAKPFAGRVLELLDDADRSVSEAAVDSLAQLKYREPEVLRRLAGCEQRHRGTALGDRVGEVLRGLGGTVAVMDGVDLAQAVVAYFELDVRLCGYLEAHVANEVVLVPWQRILKSSGDDEWKTDEDELGMLCLTPGETPSLAMVGLPVLLPIQRTGASGAKRRFEVRAVTPTGLLCSLHDPFADERGWGDDNYAYLFDPSTRGWSRVSPTSQPPGYRLTALREPAARESPANAICGGELVVYAASASDGIAFACDHTPYHLDDWKRPPEVSAILKAQSELCLRARADLWEVSAPSPQRWEVQPCVGKGEPIVLRFGRQLVLDRDTRQPAASASRVSPLAAAVVGSRLVLCLRIDRRDGTAVDSVAVVEV